MQWQENLKKQFSDITFIQQEPMSRHTTFRIGGPADMYAEPEVKQVGPLVAFCKEQGIPVTILGNGSNVLVADAGIRGLVIAIGKKMAKITVEGETIVAEAGALLSQVARAAADASLAGLAFAAGIPGTIGGALMMNAGAYGGEMKDVVTSVQVLLPDGEVVTWSAGELELSYRHSKMMEVDAIVLSAEMKLQKGDAREIQEMMDDFRGRRQEKQPLEYPSAGSTFKRPEGYFAGKLIMDAGLAGFQVGGAAVSAKHCGFVVNMGDATAKDVCDLMQQVSEKVESQYGVALEPEVRLIGEF